MKIFQILALIFVSFSVNAQDFGLKKEVDWQAISSTPSVEEGSVDSVKMQEFNPLPEKDASLNLDFLQQLDFDERIFKEFEASLRILNRNTDQLKVRKVKDSLPIFEKRYSLRVKSCAKVQVYGVENDFAFLEVSQKDNILFKGWISNINKTFNYPELRDLYITLDSCKKIVSQ